MKIVIDGKMQYRIKESSINYSSTRTDSGNNGVEGKQRRLPVESDKCRICRQVKETVMHWSSGCTRLAATEYLKRHNNAIILCVILGMQEGLLEKNTK